MDPVVGGAADTGGRTVDDPGERRWPLRGDQWSQTAYVFRDGKLYFAETDNKEQQYDERELDIAAFVGTYAATPASPYREIIAFLAGVGREP